MFSHPELGLDPPIGSDWESGCDISDEHQVICNHKIYFRIYWQLDEPHSSNLFFYCYVW